MIKITDLGRELIENAPPIMQEGFVASFSALQGWNQTMIYSCLQQLAEIMNASSIQAAPFLTVAPVVGMEAEKTE